MNICAEKPASTPSRKTLCEIFTLKIAKTGEVNGN